MSKLSWRVAAVSDRGLHRPENQDNYFVSPDSTLLAVADGMGGAKNGALASRIAIESVKSRFDEKPEKIDSNVISEWLEQMVSEANNTIYGIYGVKEVERRMGTTLLVAAHTDEGTVEIAHVGDSRAYLIRDGKANPITVDHSVVMEMHLNHQLTREQIFSSPYRNLLTRCLGHASEIKVDETEIMPRPGDWIVLCSDGLNSELRDEEIGKLVAGCATPDEACQKLLDGALSAGGRDNVTIVAIQYLALEKGK